MAYTEHFVQGDAAAGAYRCYLMLADPGGYVLHAGRPASTAVRPAAREHGSPLSAPVAAIAPATPASPAKRQRYAARLKKLAAARSARQRPASGA